MTTQKLKSELDAVRRALNIEDSEDRNRKYEEFAFNSLNPEQQKLVLDVDAMLQFYVSKAVEWEKQPEHGKKQSSFYEDYCAHSPITKHSCLIGAWVTEEEKQRWFKAADIMLEARKKFDPYYLNQMH